MSNDPRHTDYEETRDVTEVHAAVKREHREPTSESTPIPMWLTAVCGGAILWGAAYLGVFHGGFSGSVFNEYEDSPAVLFPLAKKGGVDAGPKVDPFVAEGKSTYGTCAACHQPNGMGLPGTFPPLAKSEWAIGNEKRMITIVLKGLGGPIKVAGAQYNNVMPAQDLTDKKLAAVLSYVRSNFGNAASAISPAQVAAVRKEFASRATPWTEAELLQIPEVAKIDAPAPTAPAPAGAPAPAAAPAPATPPAAAAAVPTPAPVPPPAAASFDLAASVERGKAVYSTTCIACHQPNGNGIPGAFPPFDGSEYVNTSVRQLVATVLKGINGPITVKGQTYNNILIPVDQQFPQLKDNGKLSDVLNYIRNAWSNKNPEPVTPEGIERVRTEFASRTTPWTEPELKAFQPAAK